MSLLSLNIGEYIHYIKNIFTRYEVFYQKIMWIFISYYTFITRRKKQQSEDDLARTRWQSFLTRGEDPTEGDPGQDIHVQQRLAQPTTGYQPGGFDPPSSIQVNLFTMWLKSM